MFTYFIHRVLIMVPTLFAISVLTFIIIQLPPGDYMSNQLDELRSQGDTNAAEKIQFMIKQFGLDKPMIEQYAAWVGLWPKEVQGAKPNEVRHVFSGLLQGDLGWSFEHNQPVSEIVGERLFMSFLVSFTTIVFIYVVAFPIGIYSATHQYSWGDYGLTFLGFIGLATPNFLLALVLLYLANLLFGTSVSGLMDPRYIDQPWSLAKLGSVLEHLWIPVIVIGASGTAGMIRRLRANLLDELQKQYVVTGRAKGLPARRLLMKYPLRMALNPFIADIGNLLPHVISGAAIVSVVLGLQTTGPMLLQALQSQDTYLAGSFLMFLALLTVIGVFISDLLLAVLDPRIRLGAGAGK